MPSLQLMKLYLLQKNLDRTLLRKIALSEARPPQAHPHSAPQAQWQMCLTHISERQEMPSLQLMKIYLLQKNLDRTLLRKIALLVPSPR